MHGERKIEVHEVARLSCTYASGKIIYERVELFNSYACRT
jgi:hypothetical protein